MIEIEKTINKTLVPFNFIKGLAILYTFMVVAGMVGAIESQAVATYILSQQRNAWGAAALGGHVYSDINIGFRIFLYSKYAVPFSAWGWYVAMGVFNYFAATDGISTGILFGIAASIPLWGWVALAVGL